jgi:hypothetical protein
MYIHIVYITGVYTLYVRMISTKQKTIAMSALAIVAVLALFASAPLVATHQGNAFWGRGWGGWGPGWGYGGSGYYGGWGGYYGGWPHHYWW